MNTTLYQNRPGEELNWTNLHLEPHNYRIYNVNIDLSHQYGIWKRLFFQANASWVEHIFLMPESYLSLTNTRQDRRQ